MATDTKTAAPPAPASPPKPKRPIPAWDPEANPWDKPAVYLQHYGWRCKGNPNSPHGRWFAPEDLDANGQPRAAYERKEPHTIMKNLSDPADKTGKRTIQVPHMTFDRVHVYPAPMGISRDEAVQAQLDKEFAPSVAEDLAIAK